LSLDVNNRENNQTRSPQTIGFDNSSVMSIATPPFK
jgi:hypothetical protein